MPICIPVTAHLCSFIIVYGETVIGNFDFFGTVYLYTDEFIGVCIDTFGYLEAQVSCTRIDYPFASDLYAVDRYA